MVICLSALVLTLLAWCIALVVRPQLIGLSIVGAAVSIVPMTILIAIHAPPILIVGTGIGGFVMICVVGFAANLLLPLEARRTVEELMESE